MSTTAATDATDPAHTDAASVPVPDGPPGPDVLLSLQDLRTYFHTDHGIVKAVDGVSFDVKPGEVLAVVGESGSGKSVTGLSIMGLLPRPMGRVETGRIWWKGNDLVQAKESAMRRVRGAEISMIFQDPMTALNPVFTIGAQIVEMIRIHEDVSRKVARGRAAEMLAAVGIPQPQKRLDMYPHEFSGGMRQRAMIAMAIACDPDLIIADEPTTALDVTVQSQVLEVLAAARERTGAGMILITHDLGIVAGVADRVMVMYAGRQAEMGDVDEVFYDIRHPYTRGLLNSLPRATDAFGNTRLEPIPGHPPSLVRPPSGCPFHPRCARAELPEPCSTAYPVLRDIGAGHLAACHFADESSPTLPAVPADVAADVVPPDAPATEAGAVHAEPTPASGSNEAGGAADAAEGGPSGPEDDA